MVVSICSVLLHSVAVLLVDDIWVAAVAVKAVEWVCEFWFCALP